MIVVDTCIWIEFFKCRNPIHRYMLDLLDQGQIVANEWVFAELMQGTRNDRERKIVTGYWQNLPKFSSKDLIFAAGLKSSLNHYYARGVGLIDVSILLYCQQNQSQLWTIDKKLLNICHHDEIYSPQYP